MSSTSEWQHKYRSLTWDSEIAIVGGSLTGPAAAVKLRQAGFRNVHIYEATPPTVSQAGGVMRLGRRSLAMLESVGIELGEIVPFWNDGVSNIGIHNRSEVWRGTQRFAGRDTTWTLLHQALTRRVPADSLHTGKRLTELSSDEQDRAVLHFADGSQVSADLVAFADGRRSRGRALLDPDRSLQYAGYVAYRGQTAASATRAREFVNYLPELGKWALVTAPLRMDDGHVGTDWSFFMNASAERFREQFGADPTARTFVLQHQVSEIARQDVDMAASHWLPAELADVIHRTWVRSAAPMFKIAPPERLVTNIGRSPAVLLGDAAAPVPPQTARGANYGIGEAMTLAEELERHLQSGLRLGRILDSWQSDWLPRIRRTLRTGNDIAAMFAVGD